MNFAVLTQLSVSDFNQLAVSLLAAHCPLLAACCRVPKQLQCLCVVLLFGGRLRAMD